MSLTREKWDEVMATHSGIPLMWGPTDVDRFLLDPKRIAFFMSRYKFAGKMLAKCSRILDVGCGSGMGTVTFLNETRAKILGVDFEPKVIDHAQTKLFPALLSARNDAGRLSFECRDVLNTPMEVGAFDGLACMDVIEHIEPERSGEFIAKLVSSLKDYGVAIIGTPSKLAAQYASPHSQIGHINMYDGDGLREQLEFYFRRVFMFSMNDEIVHTGFDKLAHYHLAVCLK